MNAMLLRVMLLLTGVLILSACGQRPSKNLEVNLDELDNGVLQISTETMNEIIQNIPSANEAAALINTLEVPFSTQYLADPEILSASSTSFDMAYSLGAFHADLGYLIMYEKTEPALDLLSHISRLADALQIGPFIDFDAIERLATSDSGLDSLLLLSNDSFNNMKDHLRETGRSNLSALMIAGVWMEGLYLTTQVARQYSNDDLKSMIGQQKLILNDLLLILYNYQNEELIAGYIEDLETLKTAFNEVQIIYRVGEPQAIERDDKLIVVQSESSQLTMSDDTLQKIIDLTEQVRNAKMNKG